MDRLQSMRVFVKVADSGSFVRAAERLGMNNAVVTRHVADLEAHLGARLLNRTTRALNLTEVGRAYLEKCRSILDEVDEAEALASARTTRVSGLLRVAAPVSFGMYALAHHLVSFRERYPDVVVDLILTERAVDVIEEGLDLAIVVEQMGLGPGLVGRRLRAVPVALYAAPDYVQAHGVPAVPQDLSDHACLNLSHASVRETWSLRDAQGVEAKARVNNCFLCNHVDLLRMAARKGFGIVPLPDFMATEDLACGSLVRVLPDYAFAPLNLAIVYPTRRYLLAKVRAFIDHVIAATKD